MGDVRPLPMLEDEEDQFFSDIGSDLGSNEQSSGRLALMEDRNTVSHRGSNRKNPFSSIPETGSTMPVSEPLDTSQDIRSLVSSNSRQYGAAVNTTLRRNSSRSNGGIQPHSNPKLTDMDTVIRVDHCHNYKKVKDDRVVLFQLIIVSVLTTLFGIGEAVGGYYSGSLAIASDVVHLASDLLSFIISLLAIWLAKRPATKRLNWGYYRAEVLGAVLSIFVIWVVTAVLVYLAVHRILNEEKPDRPLAMLIVAGVAIAFNIIMGIVLNVEQCKVSHGHSHDHDHGHSHGHSHSRPMFSLRNHNEDQDVLTHNTDDAEADGPSASGAVSEKNIVIRAAFIHVIGDLLQSLGVFVAACLIYFLDGKVSWIWLMDPICTFIFSILVMITTITMIRDAVVVLMEGCPKKVPRQKIYEQLMKIEGVYAVHDLAIWSLTTNHVVASCHIAIDDTVSSFEVLRQANIVLRQGDVITKTTVQIEAYDPHTMATCRECTDNIYPPSEMQIAAATSNRPI